jgi:hypothetical protein
VGGRIDDGGGPNLGQGGVGRPDGSGNQPKDDSVKVGEKGQIYDPSTVTLTVRPGQGEGAAQTVGKADGPSRRGDASVSLSQALPRYEQQAARAARSAALTPSERAVVRAYFERLSDAAGRAVAANADDDASVSGTDGTNPGSSR